MKVSIFSSLILLLGLAGPLSAIERPKSLDAEQAAEAVESQPVEDGLPERGEQAGQAEAELPPADRPASAWLGVLSEPIDETLSVHLDVASGVVLSFVAEDSPAAAAGLERHDVIVKANGRAIGNQDELREEIQTHKPGDEITLTVINRGAEVERKVVLGARPEGAVPPRGADLGLGLGALGALPDQPGLRDRMKDLNDLLPKGGEDFQRQLDAHMKRLEKQLKELEQAGGGQLKMDFGDLLDNFDNLPKPGKEQKDGFHLEFKSSGSFKLFDDQGSVEMKMKDDAREVVVRDQAGEVLFEGPWDTDQDKAAAPPEIRERVERLSDGNRLRFQWKHMPKLEMELPKPKEPELE